MVASITIQLVLKMCWLCFICPHLLTPLSLPSSVSWEVELSRLHHLWTFGQHQQEMRYKKERSPSDFRVPHPDMDASLPVKPGLLSPREIHTVHKSFLSPLKCITSISILSGQASCWFSLRKKSGKSAKCYLTFREGLLFTRGLQEMP